MHLRPFTVANAARSFRRGCAAGTLAALSGYSDDDERPGYSSRAGVLRGTARGHARRARLHGGAAARAHRAVARPPRRSRRADVVLGNEPAVLERDGAREGRVDRARARAVAQGVV